jgi:hypothetical protein
LIDTTQEPRYTDTHTAKYGSRMCNTIHMTRKSEMRDGFVARTFHIPEDLDEKLRLKAVKDKVRFSEITISALREYLK